MQREVKKFKNPELKTMWKIRVMHLTEHSNPAVDYMKALDHEPSDDEIKQCLLENAKYNSTFANVGKEYYLVENR